MLAPTGHAQHGLFISTIILWTTGLIALPVTALLIPVEASLLKLLSPEIAFAQFGNQILFLFIGSFFLARALEKHKLDKRMAYWLLSNSYISKGPELIVIVLALFSWTLSMWISNTAVAAIMVPLCLGISKCVSDSWTTTDKENFEKRLLFVCAFGASIGGMATPIGSPPNLLAMEFLNQNGHSISFLQWITWGIPLSFTLMIILILLLRWKYPIKATHSKEIHLLFSKQLHALGKMRRTEYFIVITFFTTVFLWILPDFLKIFSNGNELSSRLSMGAVAIMGAAVLFILPHEEKTILEWEDSKSIDWGTILIFGGGLCLGNILESTGLATQIGSALFSSNLSYWGLGFIIALAGVALSEISSNTTATTLLVPIIIAQFGNSDLLTSLTLLTVFSTSFGFMLPVSTPPNAIIFGTGKIPLNEMIKMGALLDIIGIIIVVLFIFKIFPMLGII